MEFAGGAGKGLLIKQQALMIYRFENTSGRFMPIRIVPYPPIEWPPSPRLKRSAIVR